MVTNNGNLRNERGLHVPRPPRSVLECIRQDIEQLEKQLAALRETESYYQLKGAGTENMIPNYRGIYLSEAVKSILSQNPGTAMTAGDLASLLVSNGYMCKNPSGLRNTVFSMLARKEGEFEKISKGKWRLKNP